MTSRPNGGAAAGGSTAVHVCNRIWCRPTTAQADPVRRPFSAGHDEEIARLWYARLDKKNGDGGEFVKTIQSDAGEA